MRGRICVITGTRADYGQLRRVMELIRRRKGFGLQIIATGMHLSPEFGLTFREIERDGFTIDRKVETLLSADTTTGIAKSMGLGIIGISVALEELRPDLLLVLGDRFEIFAAVAAATVLRIPVAHLHGGETTEGAFDEALRHAITKMAHIHFVAAEEYRRRVIQLGEHPSRVFKVGGLGVDIIKTQRLLGRGATEKALGFTFGSRNLLVTFHPVTLERATASKQMTELLTAFRKIPETHLIFTMPNADTDGRDMMQILRAFVQSRTNARVYTSLGQQLYLSCLQFVDAVVGNSSSGLTEAPSFNKGTINIGDRQRGRIRAKSVIDCEARASSIGRALDLIYSPAFKTRTENVRNPYGKGGASERIVRVLERTSLRKVLKKSFYDIATAGQYRTGSL